MIKVLTPDGKQKLIEELNYLIDIRRPEISEKIQLAKEHGDLRENAEYHDAREEQGFVEGRIIEIQNILKESEVVEINKNNQTVSLGSIVEVMAEDNNYKYTIVGSNEASPDKGLISCESPLGQALLGKNIGQHVDVELPRGLVVYKIVSIQ
jgi:transcription elongation factor GreA